MKERGDEIPVTRRVDAVRDDAREPQRRGEPGGVDRVAGAGNGARPERKLVDFRQDSVEAIVIAAERGRVREEIVRGEHGLRAAQVRVRRHQRVAGVGRSVAPAPQSAPEGLAVAVARGASDRAADRRRPVRCASVRYGAVGRHRRHGPTARARRTRERLRPAVRRRCRESSDPTFPERGFPAARSESRTPSAAEITLARSSPSAHARLPRTSSSKRRRSNRKDAPKANSSASGSPSNRPDHRCAMVSARPALCARLLFAPQSRSEAPRS